MSALFSELILANDGNKFRSIINIIPITFIVVVVRSVIRTLSDKFKLSRFLLKYRIVIVEASHKNITAENMYTK